MSLHVYTLTAFANTQCDGGGNWMPRFQLRPIMNNHLDNVPWWGMRSFGSRWSSSRVSPCRTPIRVSWPIFLLSQYTSFLRPFAKLPKATISFLMSVRPLAPTARIFMKCNIWVFFFRKSFLENSSFIKKSDKDNAVARLVEALRYKPEGRGFDSQCHWNFSLT